MGFLTGLFKQKGLASDQRAAIEEYLAASEPLWRQLESEYGQWLERMGITRGLDLSTANDPHGEQSGVFVWRTIEAERTFAQLHPPMQALALHDTCVRCLELRHQAASLMYDALQVSDVRSPKSALQQAGLSLAEALKLQKQSDGQRETLAKLLA